ncbi:CaiB/BaiF CoA transferase family protein [Salibacterium aidingense]|uniref:CaiB/BaiF CoA transferase family protein n=1 Tax=Salibacterium aidingense TaxID=384933 RepID=UPI003BEB24B9
MTTENSKPLKGILVVDFSQFLSGPSAGLRLADLGARVIKIERPSGGDICRDLYISNLELDGDSTLFHSINRNKESFSADLKNENDVIIVKKILTKADVIIQNFRPEAMKRLGFHYEEVRKLNPEIIYAEITGYGKEGPWKNMPGQDLLVQAVSGLPWLNGDAGQPPIPFGLAVADMAAGEHLVQGILACLVRRGITGKGGHVEVSLLESILDFQFELFTTYLNDNKQLPERSKINNANTYLDAPYGIYETLDGYIALAMGSIPQLGKIIGCEELENSFSASANRDTLKKIIADHLKTKKSAEWIEMLEQANYWSAEVLNWDRLKKHEGFQVLDMIQHVTRDNGTELLTTRCPIRIGGRLFKSAKASPRIGENQEEILEEVEDTK